MNQEENGRVRLPGVMAIRAGNGAQCIKLGTQVWRPKLEPAEPVSKVRCSCPPESSAEQRMGGRDRKTLDSVGQLSGPIPVSNMLEGTG